MRSPLISLLALLALLVVTGRPAADGPDDLATRMRRLKEHQQELLVRKARKVITNAIERPTGRRSARGHAPGFTPRGDVLQLDRPLFEAMRSDLRKPRTTSWFTSQSRGGRLAGGGPLAPNIQVSNPAGEEIGSSQNEPAIAAWGSYVLSAYNDWPDLDSFGSIVGYSYSANGGQTFVDGGEVPSPTGFIWSSDPVLTVNEKTGDFYFCGLLEDTLENQALQNGIGVVRATFSGVNLEWKTPVVVRQVFDSQHFLDKPWIAADSSSGYLYLTYTDFFPLGAEVSDVILFQRSVDRGVTWGPVLQLNADGGSGKVQGSRPAVGPNGEVYAVWRELGPLDPGLDFMRIRKSTNLGASFATEYTVSQYVDNYGTGAPGFNREKAVTLPSIAVDRSSGPDRGRVYVSWHESLNWYDDAPPIGAPALETEYNDYFADPDVFTAGETIYGTFRDNSDYDSWAFAAVQDSSYVFWSDSVTGSTYRLRIFCADSLTRLTYTGYPALPLDNEGNQGVMLWTCPSSGTYYLDMTNAVIAGAAVGTYRIRTGLAHRGVNDRGRDQRDAFVASSTDGQTWTTPVRVNVDPPHFDNWLPEVGVTPEGDVYSVWFDWQDGSAIQCGGLSHTYLARSVDAGITWTTSGALTDALTDWTFVESNLIPNQGDYIGLYINETAVYTAWTDGRLGTPDIYGAALSLLPVELQVVGTAVPGADRVTIDWQFVDPRVVNANVYRRSGSTRISMGSVTSDGLGHITFVDSTVAAGVQYIWTLGVVHDGRERFVGDVSATVSGAGLLVKPNPMTRFSIIAYTIPAPGGEVEVVVHDITGRRVRVLVRGSRSGGSYEVGWNGEDNDGRVVPPGIYLVRVTHAGKTSAKRISVVP